MNALVALVLCLCGGLAVVRGLYEYIADNRRCRGSIMTVVGGIVFAIAWVGLSINWVRR